METLMGALPTAKSFSDGDLKSEISDKQSRRSTISATAGFFVDMFDVFLPVVVLAPAQAYFQPANMTETEAAVAGSLILAATLLGRPLGSIIFGALSDRFGRKPITLVSVAGFGICTILMGLLPGYQHWGVWALYTLIALRFIGGIFLGGEYTAANVLAMESAPKEKRGLYSGLIQAGYPLAYIAIAALTFLMLKVFPIDGGLSSPYVNYGWRIPFFLGGILAFAVIIPYRTLVDESVMWTRTKSKRKANTLKILFNKDNRRHFIQVVVVLTGFWCTLFASAAGLLPRVLMRFVHLGAQDMTVVIMIASVALTVGFILVPSLSQITGRRNMIVLMGLLAGTVGTYCYYLLVTDPGSFIRITVLSTIVVVLTSSVAGITTCYLNERFPTEIRSTGFGVAYAAPVIVPALYGVYQGLLEKIVAPQFTPLILVVVGGLLTIVGALMGPETRDVDLKSTST
ncbi:MAG: MFS transporter [Burkholderiaceae bacterium]|nr:MAG: MFS transporter [Burkholderiaceae bacterium]